MKHKLTFSTLLLLALFLALAPTALASTTWYVNGVHGSDGNHCMSPESACKTIGRAISLAASGDTIRVAAATYAEHLSIGVNLTIIGSNAQTTIIDGDGTSIVIAIPNSAAHVSLVNLTNRNGGGVNGGGIYNAGILTISYSAITGSVAGSGGGMYNAGILTISYSAITGNNAYFGGGVLNSGTLTVNNCILSSNSALFQGGGIENYGKLTVIASSLWGNRVTNCTLRPVCRGYGGGIANENGGTLTVIASTLRGNMASVLSCGQGHARVSSGGGIDNSGMAVINNSTLSGNSALASCYRIYMHIFVCPSGGGIDNSGMAVINNSTLSGNRAIWGGGISGPATLQNSIVANSFNGGNCSGTMTSNGYNLSSDGTCNFYNSGDQNNTNPNLGPLQNNGGPTDTMALLPGSPAIDAGNPLGCTDGQGHLLKTDQRGQPRPDKEDKTGCDMGAYERQSD